jgi:sugar lactone lactonase YvrE
MAQPTTGSEPVSAFLEPSEQLQTQVSDRSFRITPPRKIAAAQAVAIVNRICASARRGLRVTAALLVLGVAAFGALGGIALNAQTVSFTATQRTLGSGFDSPGDVAVDSSGNLFVADSRNNAVKEILAAGGYTTVNTLAAANGNFSGPGGVAVDGSGNVFVADRENAAVKEIVATGGYTTVHTLGVTNGQFHNPTAVAVDGSGNVFVADQGNPPIANPTVKEILAAGGYTTVNTLAIPNGPFTTPNPTGVAVDASDNVFVTFLNQTGVLEILAAGGYTTVKTLAAASGFLDGVAVDASDNLFVTDYTVLDEIPAAGGYTTVDTLGGGFSRLYGAAVGASGTVYVGEFGKTGIVEVQPGGANFGPVNVKTASPVLSLVFTFTTGGTLGSSTVLTQGATGLDFADAGTGTCTAAAVYATGATCTIDVTFTPTRPGQRLGAVQLMGSAGTPIATGLIFGEGTGPMVTFSPPAISTVGGGFLTPDSISMDGSGNVFVADSSHNAVKEILAVDGVVLSTSTVNPWAAASMFPLAYRWTGVGTYSSRTVATVRRRKSSRSMAWCPPAPRSTPWAAASPIPMTWRWTGVGTYSSQIVATMR